jgi:hypothetical protein
MQRMWLDHLQLWCMRMRVHLLIELATAVGFYRMKEASNLR